MSEPTLWDVVDDEQRHDYLDVARTLRLQQRAEQRREAEWHEDRAR